jgi:putative hydrolase of the HAD superfamily
MSAGMIDLVLVDFDDTIVDTAPRFQNARRGLFSFLEAAGVAAADIVRLHHERVDAELVEVYGLGPARLEHSFRATYQAICRELGLAADPRVGESCADFGRTVAGTPPSFEGALPALQRLAARYPTVLYTQAADAAYQLACVRESGVTAVLGEDAIHVCARKTAAALSNVLERCGADPQRSWMVGNSVRSDVNPALEIGARAILVEAPEPWAFDVVEPISQEFVRRPSFASAVDFLLGLER